MTTEADKKRDEALSHIRAAIKSLSEIVVDQCSGTSDFRSAYRSKLQSAMDQLIRIREDLES